MKILVDADACPCNAIIEKVAKEYGITLLFLVDSNHILSSAFGNEEWRTQMPRRQNPEPNPEEDLPEASSEAPDDRTDP